MISIEWSEINHLRKKAMNLSIHPIHQMFIQSTSARRYYSILRTSLLLLFIGLMASCISTFPLSNEVRPGGTLMAAIGASEGADLLKKENLVATFKDSASVDHVVKVARVLRVYPDSTSRFGRGAPATPHYGPMYYNGQWLAIVYFVDANNDPIVTALGDGKLRFEQGGNLVGVEMDVNILGGGNAPRNLLETQPLMGAHWLDYAEIGEHAAIRLTGIPNGRVAGATFTLNYDPAGFFNVAGFEIEVSKATIDPNMQLAWSEKDIAGGQKELTILISNPHGFDVPGDSFPSGLSTLERRKSLERDLSSVLISWTTHVSASIKTQAELDGYMTLVGSNFYDADGEVLGDLTAILEYMD